jgi:hypothetical protein
VTDRPRIIVHSLGHATAALEAASALHRPVTLASAPGAGCYMGPRWFLALVAAARAACPAADADCVLDCADEPGTVLGALRAGAKRVRFTGRADVRAKLADIARASGATIEHEDVVPALDLLAEADPLAAARTALGAAGG